MTPQERRTKILQLLDHWQDFFQPASSGQTTNTASDDTPSQTGVISSWASHKSVVELGRCLAVLRRMGPGHYRHLAGFYDAEWRTTDRPVAARTIGGRKRTTKPVRVRERVVPGWVERRLVERGVDFVAGVWDVRGAGEPELPGGLYRAMRRELVESVDPVTGLPCWTEAA